VVLDEGKKPTLPQSTISILTAVAHTIQNSQSHLAQACYALSSLRRWAITGTPIQNKLTDFASIVKFLRVYPYADARNFEHDILKPWRDGRGTDPQGFLRLKVLVRAITIGRTKAVINLPPRLDEIHRLHFTEAERDKYDSVKTKSRNLLEEATSSGRNGGKTFNALSLLNILRLICNHGLLGQHSLNKRPLCTTGHTLTKQQWPEEVNLNIDNILDGSRRCQSCGEHLLEDLLEGPTSFGGSSEILTDAMNPLHCMRCRFQNTDETLSYSQEAMPELPSSIETSSASTPTAEPDNAHTLELMSTKIKALVHDLSKHAATEKRLIFRMMLSLHQQLTLSVSFSLIGPARLISFK
jgi:SWI/SNF-related matrix-associated actin-dependent regulator of chromatin subfamily A3